MCATFSSALELVTGRELHIPHILHMLVDFMIVSLSEEACGLQLCSFLYLFRCIGVIMSNECPAFYYFDFSRH